MPRYVEEIMQREVVTVTPDTPVRDFLRLLVDAHISGVPVVADSGEIVGVVSATDVIRLGAEAPEVPGGSLQWTPMALPNEEYDNIDNQEPFHDRRNPGPVHSHAGHLAILRLKALLSVIPIVKSHNYALYYIQS